jgi:hypothetical protein
MAHLTEAFRDLTHQRPVGWDASMAWPSDDRRRWLLAGDANAFVDPSPPRREEGDGVGWLVAVAVNTALTQPALATTAFDFFAARERATYAQFLALTRQFLLDGAPAPDHPLGRPRPAGRRREAVLAAWDRIRAAGQLAAPRPRGHLRRPAARADRARHLRGALVTRSSPTACASSTAWTW